MSARPIGEILQPVLDRAYRMAALQQVLRQCPTLKGRKSLIMAAWEHNAITDEDAQILIEAEGLETA